MSQTEDPLSDRLAWVDFAKGIGIFLVVLGHTIRGLFTYNYSENAGPLRWADIWIYSFHMPLFFLASGLFIQRSSQRGWKEFSVRKLGTIVYPYVVWSLLQGIVQSVVKPETTTTAALSDLWRISYQPKDHFWFLYVLLAVTLLFWICERVLPLWLFVALSVALYVGHIFNVQLALFDPIDHWSVFYLVRAYAIYFALGAILIRGLWIRRILAGSNTRLLIASALCVGVLSVVVTLRIGELGSDPANSIAWLCIAPFLAVMGMTAVVLTAQTIARSNRAKFLEMWGKLSLQIYVAHVIFTAMFRVGTEKLFGLHNAAFFLVMGTAIGIAGPLLLTRVTQRFNSPYLFEWRSAKPAGVAGAESSTVMS